MTRKKSRNPTLADVAKKAGVSKMTVSNVVNGRVNLVRDQTRERVSQAIQQIGYRPHIGARSLRLARGWAIGMLVITQKSDFVTMQWMSKLVAGLSNYLNEHGYGLLIHNLSPDALDSSILLRRAQTDALVAIVSGPTDERDAIYQKLLTLNQPLIALQESKTPAMHHDMAVVKQDDFGGAATLGAYLITIGARKVVFIEPDLAWPAMAERIRALSSAMKAVRGASLKVIRCRDEAFEHVEAAILKELAEGGLPDAFVGGNELITLAALTVLETTGHKVPEDVRLTGFNSFELWFFAKRKITTVTFPAYEIGTRTGELILERLASGRFPKRMEILPAALQIGDTTAIRSRYPESVADD